MTITPRVLQRSDAGPIVALFFCGDSFPSQRSKLLDALPRECTVLALDSDRRHAVAMRAAVLALPAERQRWLVGYSAGGHRVRDCLDLVRDGDVVVTADATHASFESRPQTMPLRPWLELGERATSGAVRWMSSHTYLTYVESLREPYYATVTVMRRASRLLLPEPQIAAVEARTVGGLTVWSYESGPADGPAHARQVREALPKMLREATAELCPRHEPTFDILPAPPRTPLELVHERLWARHGRAPTRGELALERARAWLETGVAEIAGPESHPMIYAALQRCVRDGRPVGLTSDETDWCAAAASAWCEWLTPRISVRELVEDARTRAAWRDVASGYVPVPGDLEVYARAGEDPRRGGRGHVAIVESRSDAGSVTIGGNERNAVRRTTEHALPVVGWIVSA
jgi:hypothetical protein